MNKEAAQEKRGQGSLIHLECVEGWFMKMIFEVDPEIQSLYVCLFSELRKGGMAIQIDGNFEIVVWRCGRSWWITGLLEQAHEFVGDGNGNK